MSAAVKAAFRSEMALARAARTAGQFDRAMHHLERAHIIGQRYFLPHLASHIAMLRLAAQRGERPEMRGQLARIVAVAPGYLFGWVPVGNPGSARVSPLRVMPVPDDLQKHFAGYSLWRDVAIRAGLLAAAALLAATLA